MHREDDILRCQRSHRSAFRRRFPRCLNLAVAPLSVLVYIKPSLNFLSVLASPSSSFASGSESMVSLELSDLAASTQSLLCGRLPRLKGTELGHRLERAPYQVHEMDLHTTKPFTALGRRESQSAFHFSSQTFLRLSFKFTCYACRSRVLGVTRVHAVSNCPLMDLCRCKPERTSTARMSMAALPCLRPMRAFDTC